MPEQYGHYHPVNASNPNAVRADKAMGEHIQRQDTMGSAHPDHGPATWSTAPYIPPKAVRCVMVGCNNRAKKGTGGVCAEHLSGKATTSGDAGATT